MQLLKRLQNLEVAWDLTANPDADEGTQYMTAVSAFFIEWQVYVHPMHCLPQLACHGPCSIYLQATQLLLSADLSALSCITPRCNRGGRPLRGTSQPW